MESDPRTPDAVTVKLYIPGQYVGGVLASTTRFTEADPVQQRIVTGLAEKVPTTPETDIVT
jgi:hypothetical protein